MQVSINRRRRDKRNATALKGLVAVPAVGAFVMPASSTTFLKSVAGCVAGTSAVTLATSNGDRVIETPLLSAGELMPAGYIEKGITVTLATGFELFAEVGLDLRKKIAEGA